MVWSGVKGEDPVIQYSDELGPDDYATPLRDFLCEWESYDQFEVACERFTITIDTAKKAQAPYSLEQIGVLKQICRATASQLRIYKLTDPSGRKEHVPQYGPTHPGTVACWWQRARFGRNSTRPTTGGYRLPVEAQGAFAGCWGVTNKKFLLT